MSRKRPNRPFLGVLRHDTGPTSGIGIEGRLTAVFPDGSKQTSYFVMPAFGGLGVQPVSRDLFDFRYEWEAEDARPQG